MIAALVDPEVWPTLATLAVTLVLYGAACVAVSELWHRWERRRDRRRRVDAEMAPRRVAFDWRALDVAVRREFPSSTADQWPRWINPSKRTVP